MDLQICDALGQASERDTECTVTKWASTLHSVPEQCWIHTRNISRESMLDVHEARLELGMPHSTMHNFSHKTKKFHTYKLQLMQKITHREVDSRKQFSRV
jgi:hypothetical protein